VRVWACASQACSLVVTLCCPCCAPRVLVQFGANLNGGVRHAAEAVNYYFPQELDDEFLVVWEGFHASSEDGFWKRMGPEGLKVQVPSQHSKF